jgi:hypothetical protein
MWEFVIMCTWAKLAGKMVTNFCTGPPCTAHGVVFLQNTMSSTEVIITQVAYRRSFPSFVVTSGRDEFYCPMYIVTGFLLLG